MIAELPAALRPGAHVHLVGVGGAGMSALARILLERGHPTSGSDRRGGPTLETLAALGAQVHVGHAAEHITGADLVVTSTAVPPDNAEIVAAASAGVPILRRAELLAALIAGQRGILVAGTHGKTTTTAMLTVGLQGAGLDPSFAIGGTLTGVGVSAADGAGELFVAEADESDGSFLVFAPDCAIVTNVELDHHYHWAGLDAVMDAFAEFLARRRPGGLAICCADDPGSAALAARATGTVLTYGTSAEADVQVRGIELGPAGSSFSVHAQGEDLGRFSVQLLGLHNVRNAAAVITACRWAGADLRQVADALARFRGADRRFTAIGHAGGIDVVDDYAHHPTELTAVLSSARQSHPEGRVIALFQPHRYSRTAALGPELGAALADADVVVVTDVYGSGEDPIPGVDGQAVADSARRTGADARYTPRAHAAATVAELAQPGDLVLTLGAGDVTELGPDILAQLGDDATREDHRAREDDRG
jgi:UDP-N-acetylmuramate--alanine ligase